MGLIDAIGAGPVALDTVAFIYFIEEHPRFLPVLLPVFESIDSQRLPAVASSLTLLEVLVVPYRSGNVALAERYEEILIGSRGLRLLDIDRAQLRTAAHLRALHAGLRAPDSIHLSAALHAGCTCLVTNDTILPSISGVRILQIEHFATGPS